MDMKFYYRTKVFNHTILGRCVPSVVDPKMGMLFHRITDKHWPGLPMATGLILGHSWPGLGIAGDLGRE